MGIGQYQCEYGLSKGRVLALTTENNRIDSCTKSRAPYAECDAYELSLHLVAYFEINQLSGYEYGLAN